MPLLLNGVSGGVPVSNQVNGVAMTLLNDYGYILPSNNAPTQGPDTQGVLTLSAGLAGGYLGSPVVAFEKCIGPGDFANNNWTALLGLIPRTTSTQIGGNTFTLAANQSIDFTVPSVQGFYAIRTRLLTLPLSGSVVVSGSTFAAVAGALNPSEQALFNQFNQLQFAQCLAECDSASADYLAMATGSSYP